MSGDEHIVTGNISIASGASLTIQPGYTVRFAHATQLTVTGSLNILGTAADGVLLTRRDASDEWSGLEFRSGSSGKLEYCTIEHATRYNGIGVYANGGDVEPDNCLLHENDYGLYVQNASPDLVNCRIVDNNLYGMYMTGACSPSFGIPTGSELPQPL